jgi:NifB/MoaA-like Fe-S oxidoreductase
VLPIASPGGGTLRRIPVGERGLCLLILKDYTGVRIVMHSTVHRLRARLMRNPDKVTRIDFEHYFGDAGRDLPVG